MAASFAHGVGLSVRRADRPIVNGFTMESIRGTTVSRNYEYYTNNEQ